MSQQSLIFSLCYWMKMDFLSNNPFSIDLQEGTHLLLQQKNKWRRSSISGRFALRLLLLLGGTRLLLYHFHPLAKQLSGQGSLLLRAYFLAHTRVSLLFLGGSFESVRNEVATIEFVPLRDADGVIVVGVGQRADFLAPLDGFVLDHRISVFVLSFLFGREVLFAAVVLVLLGDLLVLFLLERGRKALLVVPFQVYVRVIFAFELLLLSELVGVPFALHSLLEGGRIVLRLGLSIMHFIDYKPCQFCLHLQTQQNRQTNLRFLQSIPRHYTLTHYLNMAEQPYPQNLPYIHSNSTARLSRAGDSDNLKVQPESASSEALMQRIQDLERQLGSLTTLLMEDGGFQQAYLQLQEENEELRAMLKDQGDSSELVKQLEVSNQLLKDNLLKQNEQMEDLYRDLQEARTSNSRVQERGHSQLLQSKVQGLDEEISSLLAKIHALMEENNELIASEQEMSRHIGYLEKSAEEAEKKVKELQMENQILKQEIQNVEELSITQQRNVQDTYMNQLEEANQQIDELKAALQKAQARPGQISRNTTERGSEERSAADQEIVALRNQLASKNEQLLWQRQNEANLRRKYEQRMSVDEGDMMAMNEELSKLRYRLRQQESRCAQYEFALEQQQKDKERLAFYKNSFSDSEQLRSTIARLQAEKEELILRAERLKAELSQRKYQQVQTVQVERKEAFNFMQSQSDDELERSKQLNKKLKQAIGKYEQDYKQLREDYERLLAEKIEAQRVITTNQLELQRHKAIYEQLVGRYNDTASLYRELQQKLRTLETERNGKPAPTNYDKENVQLVKLENSTLRQEIQSLKQQLSQPQHKSPQADFQDYKKEMGELKRRERQLSQQLQLYRQKYLKQLQKSRGDKQLEGIVVDLQGKLQRVNSLLNQKLREIDYLHNRQNELMHQVDQIYEKCRMEFDNFGVRHHPEVKKLHSELLAAQRQLMESELTFKQQISSIEDELRACRLQNQHHRAKIDELLQEANRERNSLDYSKLMRSLQLSELAEKELRSQLQQREHLIHDLKEQLKRNTHKERPKLQSSSYNSSLKQSRRSQMSRYEQLARKRQQIAEQFKHSQQFLLSPKQQSSRQEKHGILHRLRENLAA